MRIFTVFLIPDKFHLKLSHFHSLRRAVQVCYNNNLVVHVQPYWGLRSSFYKVQFTTLQLNIYIYIYIYIYKCAYTWTVCTQYILFTKTYRSCIACNLSTNCIVTYEWHLPQYTALNTCNGMYTHLLLPDSRSMFYILEPNLLFWQRLTMYNVNWSHNDICHI